MSSQENSQALSDFFSKYNSDAYTYDPQKDSNEEFDRLCDARRWDQTKKENKHEKYLTALQGRPSSKVGMFFRKHWVPGFVYNPLELPWVEFDRLQEKTKTTEKKYEEVLLEFGAAVDSDAAPIAVFFEKWGGAPGYSYGSDRAELEFKNLVEAHRHVWEQRIRIWGDAQGGEGQGRWRESTTFKWLQEGFYGAVEEQFGIALDKIGRMANLRRDEVLAELFRVGQSPLTEEEAEMVSWYPDSQGPDFQVLTREITIGLRIRPLKRLRFHKRKR